MVERRLQRGVASTLSLPQQCESSLYLARGRVLRKALDEDGACELVRVQACRTHVGDQTPSILGPATAHHRVHGCVEGDCVRPQPPGLHPRKDALRTLGVAALRASLEQGVEGDDIRDGWRLHICLADQLLHGRQLIGCDAGCQHHVQHQAVDGHTALLHVPEDRDGGFEVLALRVHAEHRHVGPDRGRGHRRQAFEEGDGPLELADLGREADEAAASDGRRSESVLVEHVVHRQGQVVLLLARELAHGALVERQWPVHALLDHVVEEGLHEVVLADADGTIYQSGIQLQRTVPGRASDIPDAQATMLQAHQKLVLVHLQSLGRKLETGLLLGALDDLVEEVRRGPPPGDGQLPRRRLVRRRGAGGAGGEGRRRRLALLPVLRRSTAPDRLRCGARHELRGRGHLLQARLGAGGGALGVGQRSDAHGEHQRHHEDDHFGAHGLPNIREKRGIELGADRRRHNVNEKEDLELVFEESREGAKILGACWQPNTLVKAAQIVGRS
mmetsp:Transcript_70198/g.178029  ORF Transcript_70198/g.178029 Transcript_70198/m.178029 type:complete len:502 (-) Transcript_70198:14-1519(-)